MKVPASTARFRSVVEQCGHPEVATLGALLFQLVAPGQPRLTFTVDMSNIAMPAKHRIFGVVQSEPPARLS